MLRLAANTIDVIHRAGLPVTIVSSDPAVTRWGAAHAEQVVPEPSAGGLNAAALAGVSAVPHPWIVVHADLPALGVEDIAAAARLAHWTMVIAPSRDGGTSLLGSNGDPPPFCYGPGSYRRHLSVVRGEAITLFRRGLALDLDRPWDLTALRRLGYLPVGVPEPPRPVL
jgi:2-phospho-L-lactate guanylyltransferase